MTKINQNSDPKYIFHITDRYNRCRSVIWILLLWYDEDGPRLFIYLRGAILHSPNLPIPNLQYLIYYSKYIRQWHLIANSLLPFSNAINHLKIESGALTVIVLHLKHHNVTLIIEKRVQRLFNVVRSWKLEKGLDFCIKHISIQSFDKFQIIVSGIQMKRAMRPFIHTDRLTTLVYRISN